ncbi:hypothetical protein HUK80_08135 [Flavobacterium sp. MAH-1]|uniref:Uncharacterized protein n=1 Tax=Flavobacterium agri TaxID=2743471 RepID=A0A7Y8Y1V8_9FLAO|nr:hypothetical protein [Flavobacterium agri]NUY80858.1 hypothetical protein [Flavobacterium agri]NYA70882.1 hypothetical protein [Flavobacterium agri]
MSKGDEVSSIFGVNGSGIPLQYLINPDGIVVAKNPTPAELEAWVK